MVLYSLVAFFFMFILSTIYYDGGIFYIVF